MSVAGCAFCVIDGRHDWDEAHKRAMYAVVSLDVALSIQGHTCESCNEEHHPFEVLDLCDAHTDIANEQIEIIATFKRQAMTLAQCDA